jgi:hypothetical protein
MTKGKPIVEGNSNTDAKDKLVSSEKPIAAPKDAALDANSRDEQDRRTILFASVVFVFLAAPVFLAMEGDRSFWRLTRHDTTAQAILVVVFGWPVCLGIVGFLRAWRRKVPGKGLIGVATAFTTIQTLAAAVLFGMLMWEGHRESRSPLVWLGAVAAALAIAMVVRSFFRTGWQRWQSIMAPIALLAVMIVLILAGVDHNAMEHVAQGSWVFLFATAALIPFIGTTLFARQS